MPVKEKIAVADVSTEVVVSAEPVAPVAAAEPVVSMTMLEEILKRVFTYQAQAQPAGQSNAGLTKEILTAAFTEAYASERKSKLEEAERKSTYPRISARNPLGDRDNPLPRLVGTNGEPRTIIFCTTRETEEDLSRAEIELYNQFTENCEVKVKRWTAAITTDGFNETLTVDLPIYTRDQRDLLPKGKRGKLIILQELLDGKTTQSFEDLAARVAELQEQVARAEAAKKAAESATAAA